MNLITQIAGMVIGFVTVMLAASLVVSVLVRVVHYLGDKRSKTLGEMLGGLNRAFRAEHGDLAQAGDAPQTTFELDVLTYPTLYVASDAMVPSRRARKQTAQYLDVQNRRQAVAAGVEYLTQANLIDIVKRLSAADANQPVDTRGMQIPARWYGHLDPKARTVDQLIKFIDTWYKTVEHVGTQSFALASRRLTAVLSCVVVVFLCLDGIQLGVDLFRASAQVKDHLAEQGATLLHSSTQAEAIHPTGQETADRDALLKDVDASLTQTNSVLNEPGLNLGWQSSWMVKEIARVKHHHPSANTSARYELPGANGGSFSDGWVWHWHQWYHYFEQRSDIAVGWQP